MKPYKVSQGKSHWEKFRSDSNAINFITGRSS